MHTVVDSFHNHFLCCSSVYLNCLQAPRAKMNQQRSRRFRASKEGVELVEEKNKMREEVIQRGGRGCTSLTITTSINV